MILPLKIKLREVIHVLMNLKAEMARNNITTDMVMRSIGRSDKTTRDKINGKSGFLLSEAVKVRDELFPGMDIEYLFAQSDDAS